ncbi:MAG: Ferric iron ABC transporter, permease protein [uncultured Acidimicrobiales bacterium]|uniref:Ferric iron ABC transporter, permease protein n=1 Tax=uncultured Acidimicrobiales bacterium TaxID=310071 RepID=A0A6J4HSI9_9ACTN|nr:MAG: Ferric iron ABC transporter, permease protein [uncultured Acidimicrobiales bacterium]
MAIAELATATPVIPALPKGPAAPRPPLFLRVTALATALLFAAPVGYVLWRALGLGADVGQLVDEIGPPLWRTVQLAVLTSTTTALLGTGLAWLLVRTDLPGRSVLRGLAPLPLVFPSFVGAAAFIAGLAPGGALRGALELVGVDAPARFRGLGPSWLVLTLFTYPYVYLPVAARLRALPPSWEESARLLGDTPRRLFGRVILPHLRRAILGGGLLVFLYSLSEFGAVQLLGFDTLTRVIYATRLVDRAQSFGAASVLLVLAVVVVLAERRMAGASLAVGRSADRQNRPVALGRWRWPALAGVVAVLFVGLVVPLLSLGQWALRGLTAGNGPGANLADELGSLRLPAFATAQLGLGAGVLTVVAVFPSAYLCARYRSRLAGIVSAAVLGGFAMPGLVIALSLVFWSLNVPGFDRFYQSVPLLLAAYVVHFGSQAMRATELAVAAVPDRLRESARLLGASPMRRATSLEAPLMRPGLLAAVGLVLLATVKELPATLLLAPTRVDTLSTRLWKSFEEGFLAEAGLASLALVAVSGLLTWLLVLRRAHHLA